MILYDYDTCTILYEAYAQAKATIAENTMPSTSNFEPACISNVRQKMVLPISHMLNQKSEVLTPSPPLP